jgi:hypothetical protein
MKSLQSYQDQHLFGMNNYNPELFSEALKEFITLSEVLQIFSHMIPDFNTNLPLDSMGMQTSKLPIDKFFEMF